jgi:hypothetical protein
LAALLYAIWFEMPGSIGVAQVICSAVVVFFWAIFSFIVTEF